jgi:hypothetical protein
MQGSLFGSCQCYFDSSLDCWFMGCYRPAVFEIDCQVSYEIGLFAMRGSDFDLENKFGDIWLERIIFFTNSQIQGMNSRVLTFQQYYSNGLHP